MIIAHFDAVLAAALVLDPNHSCGSALLSHSQTLVTRWHLTLDSTLAVAKTSGAHDVEQQTAHTDRHAINEWSAARI